MNKTYAITDLHGMWNLWEQISEYCDETDTIYFLGDAIDRGIDGLRVMESLLKDKRVIYLLGNHEEFFLNIAPKLKSIKNINEILVSSDDDLYLWLCNGGYDTMKSFLYATREEQDWFLNELSKLEDLDIYINKYDKTIYLCHAGTSPDYDKTDFLLLGNNNPYTWDRHHFYKPWAKKGLEDCFVVHGHTPVQYLWQKHIVQPYGRIVNEKLLPVIATYADGHKFDLDLGCFETKTVALFDLDELKVEKYFEIEED